MTNDNYYERFNTKVDAEEDISITRQHRVLTERTSQETFKKFYDLSSDKKIEASKDTKEGYLSYIFLRKGGKQHKKLRVDLQNDFTTGDDQ